VEGQYIVCGCPRSDPLSLSWQRGRFLSSWMTSYLIMHVMFMELRRKATQKL
jgi:hypothetical protein